MQREATLQAWQGHSRDWERLRPYGENEQDENIDKVVEDYCWGV
jgi:hypothetical protein